MNHFTSFKLETNQTISVLGYFFALFFILGLVFPDSWWGIHFLAFLPPLMKYGLLLISVGITSIPLFDKKVDKPLKVRKVSSLQAGIGIGLASILMGLLFWHFPIFEDIYGDAVNYRPLLEEKVEILPPQVMESLLSFDFKSHGGRETVTSFINLISWWTGLSYGQSFRLLDLVSGILFVVTWLLITRFYFKEIGNMLLFGLIGLSSPFLLIFYGHMENYAPILWLELLWLALLHFQIKNKKAPLLWGLLVLEIILMKLHPTMILLLPGLGLAFVNQYGSHFRIGKSLLSWKGVSWGVFLPAFIGFLYIYFFYLQDHLDDRILTDVAGNHIFLPLFSPEAPLDRYNLLSFNHFFDYFQLLLFLSPPALFLLIYFLFKYQKTISWEQPNLLVGGLTLLLFIGFFFLVNPLYSLPLDWDLFSLCGPVLLMFIVLVGRELNLSSLTRSLLPAVAGLALLSSSVIWVHASREPLSYRLEATGIHIFKTYYQHSANTLLFALGLVEGDVDLYLKRKAVILNKLQAYAVLPNDKNYSDLLIDDAITYLKAKAMPDLAHKRLLEAEKYGPANPQTLYFLVETHFGQRDYTQAFSKAKQLIELSYPNKEKALQIGIQSGIMAGEYEESEKLCKDYLALQPEDAFFQRLLNRLVDKEDLEQLPGLFQADQ